MNDDLDLAPIEARAAAATPVDVKDALARLLTDAIDPLSYGIHGVGSFYDEDDAVFVAHARTDIDALCREVRRLRGDRDHARAWAKWQHVGSFSYGPPEPGERIASDGWSGFHLEYAPATSDPPA